MVMMMIVGPCVGMVGVLSCIGHKVSEGRGVTFSDDDGGVDGKALADVIVGMAIHSVYRPPHQYTRSTNGCYLVSTPCPCFPTTHPHLLSQPQILKIR